MRKNDSDFYMLVGRVEEVTDEGNRYVVKVPTRFLTVFAGRKKPL